VSQELEKETRAVLKDENVAEFSVVRKRQSIMSVKTKLGISLKGRTRGVLHHTSARYLVLFGIPGSAADRRKSI
jgi:hypothetical protein